MEKPLLRQTSSPSWPPAEGSLKPKRISVANVEDLPDLTDKLKEHGLHEEYVQFREGYMRWRRGEASGAKGELDVCIARSKEFEHWYPTVASYNFRRTISFWGGTLTMEGCLLFLWVAFFGEYGKEYPDLVYYLTKWPTLCGGMAFLAGIYMAYYELINIESDIDKDSRNFIWCDWRGLMKLDIEIWSIIAAVVYLLGALLYTMAQISDIFTLTEKQAIQLVQWPLNIGGFLFFVAGVCEMLINRVFTTLPVTLAWWASVFDFLGGVGFWVSACPSLLTDEQADLAGAIGVLGYLGGAISILLMWRGEQYGSAIIPVLNHASRDGCPNVVVRTDKKTGICHIIATPLSPNSQGDTKLGDVLAPKLSPKGMIFISIYVLIGVVQMLVSCAYLSQSDALWWGGVKGRRVLCNFISDICNVIMVHMILLLHSACVKIPRRNEQPYRGLFIGMRVLSIILVLNSILELEVIFEKDTKVGS